MADANWASLPSDLVRRVGDCLLDTNDIDTYMDMRAVCPSWRSVTAKPPPLGAVGGDDDLRFRPRQWVLLSVDDDDDTCIFVHVSTGRFLRRRLLPWLRDHALIGASDGLLVLGDRKPSRTIHPFALRYRTRGHARLLNPLTGSLLKFAAALPPDGDVTLAGMDDRCKLALVYLHLHEPLAMTSNPDIAVCAGATSQVFASQPDICTDGISTMVAYQGDVYLAYMTGHVFKLAGTMAAERYHGRLVAGTSPYMMDVSSDEEGSYYAYNTTVSYLVESGGELLLVRHLLRSFRVFRVDVERKLLEPLESIGGGRALFLDTERCVSVDADKLPSVDGDCIYAFTCLDDASDGSSGGWARHSLKDGHNEIICTTKPSHRLRPFSLVQVLLDYCNDLTRL